VTGSPFRRPEEDVLWEPRLTGPSRLASHHPEHAASALPPLTHFGRANTLKTDHMISFFKTRCSSLRRWLQFGWLLLGPSLVQAADPTVEQIEFFEKGIRPVLVEKCYSCHSAQSPKAMGGLRLDTAENLLKGGDSGPAAQDAAYWQVK
jgi:Planctomycete cytochrome C